MNININIIKRSPFYLIKAICYVPFILPYRAWRYGASRANESMGRIKGDVHYRHQREKINRYETRLGSFFTGAGMGFLLGMVYGAVIGSLIFPGVGTAAGATAGATVAMLVGLAYGAYLGACLGAAAGIWVPKMLTNLCTESKYLYTKLIGGYYEKNAEPKDYPPQGKKLPPVNFSNQSKYLPYAELEKKDGSTVGIYKNQETQQEYEARDVWTIMSYLYRKKQENKKGMTMLLILSRFSSKRAEQYENKKTKNKEFNAALEEARKLNFVCAEPAGLTQTVPDTRKSYQLQIGSFYYYVRGPKPEDSLAQLRSRDMYCVAQVPSPTV